MKKRTVYAVAFKDDKFLMVFNPKRMGWEMPGGSIEDGEMSDQAAVREFIEEAGYDVEVVETRDIGYCDVCACRLLEEKADDCEMRSELFSKIPNPLSFDRKEYEDIIPWAKKVIDIGH